MPNTYIFRNSSIDNYLTCPAMYYFRSIRGIEPTQGAIALEFGSSIHLGAAWYYRTTQEETDNSEYAKARYTEAAIDLFMSDFTAKDFPYHKQKNIEIGAELLKQLFSACAYWPHEIIAVERTYYQPIGTFLYRGTIDLLVKRNGRLIVIDHKTVGRLSSNTALKWKLRRQFAGYLWLVGAKELTANVLHTVQKPEVLPLPFLFSTSALSRWRRQTLHICNSIMERTERYRIIEVNNLLNASCLPDSLFPRVGTKCQIYGCAYESLCLQDIPIQRVIVPKEDFNETN